MISSQPVSHALFYSIDWQLPKSVGSLADLLFRSVPPSYTRRNPPKPWKCEEETKEHMHRRKQNLAENVGLINCIMWNSSFRWMSSRDAAPHKRRAGRLPASRSLAGEWFPFEKEGLVNGLSFQNISGAVGRTHSSLLSLLKWRCIS